MKVVRLIAPAGLDKLTVCDEPEPALPGAGEISVRISAVSLNYHDYLVVAGMIPSGDGRIPMSDGAGEVVAVGKGVTDFKPGDRVMTLFFPDWQDGGPQGGGFARVPGDGMDGYAREIVVAPATAFTHAPRRFSHEEAATLPTAALTAWRALVEEGRLKAGDAVLVQGTGGVSIFALQIAKAMGATVVALSSSPEKLARLTELGADHVINYREVELWGPAVRAALGRGVDQVVEVGGAGTFQQSVAACRDGGHIAVIGMLSGAQGAAPIAPVMARQLRVTGLTVGNRRQQIDMVRAIEAIGLKPILDRSFPIEELAEAFRYQVSGAHFGKIVCRM